MFSNTFLHLVSVPVKALVTSSNGPTFGAIGSSWNGLTIDLVAEPFADLSGADLSGASLSNANLFEADLSGADLHSGVAVALSIGSASCLHSGSMLTSG